MISLTKRTLIEQRCKLAIQEKDFPGCVIGVVEKSGKTEIFSFGSHTYEPDSALMEPDSIFDVASITKSIPVGSIALQLIDQGKLGVNDLAIKYIPELSFPQRSQVTIKHLLTYTFPGYGLGGYKDLSSEALFQVLMNKDPEEESGSVFRYTNVPAFFLGLVVERILGSTIDSIADKQFFQPLGMHDSTFHPHCSLNRVVPTEYCDWRKTLVHGKVHDESAYSFKEKGGRVVGHAGLFSTAPDLLIFLHMLLNNGVHNNVSFFPSNIVQQMYTNQIAELHEYNGLGWELNQPRYMGDDCFDTFGKTGFTGTLCLANIRKGKALVILSNRIFPKRPPTADKINTFRRDIANFVFNEAPVQN